VPAVLTIDVSQAAIRPGQIFRQQLSYIPETGDLSEDPKSAEPVTIAVEYSFLKGVYLVKGKVSARMGMECGRCLEPFTHLLEAEFIEQYDTETVADESDSDANVVVAERIDLTQKVRAVLLGAVPMKPLCRDDCPGLCGTCGVPLAEATCGCVQDEIDPRLKDLAHLMEGLKKKGVE